MLSHGKTILLDLQLHHSKMILKLICLSQSTVLFSRCKAKHRYSLLFLFMPSSLHPLWVFLCRSRAFCGDTGISSGCRSQAQSPTLNSSAQPHMWRHHSQRSTVATASKATPSTTARAIQTYSDQTALSYEGGPQQLALEVPSSLFF